jgi:hypothetical protein
MSSPLSKAGAQADLDSGLRGCKEIDDRLDQHRASFETAASQLPQDEEFFLMPSKAFLMLKGASRSTHSRDASNF